jgi:predicted MFS family arabinose efflux permease
VSSFALFRGERGRVAAGLLIAEFASATQSLVATTVMPRIASDLHGLSLYGFAPAALLGGSLVSMTFAGPAADRHGTARVLAVAFVLAFAGLLASMLAPSMPFFIASRAIEGLGGGLDYVVSVTAVATLFPENLRARMFAWISGMWIVPGLIGPSLGAAIASLFGWRYAFALFIPLILLSAALLFPALAKMTPMGREGDPLGALRILFSRSILALQDPRSVAIVAFALLQGAFFGADAYVSLLLTSVRGLSLSLAGACITLAVIGWTIGSTVQPRLIQIAGARGLVSSAAGLGIAAIVAMIAVAAGAPAAVAFIAWTIAGIGIGLSYATLTLAAIDASPEGAEGTVSSATLVAGVVGSTLAISACGLPSTIAHTAGAPLAGALVWTFVIALAFAIALAVISVRLPGPVQRS